MKKISIQGVQASFHDIAAKQFFGADTTREYCETFEATLAAACDGTADYALCAIENSLYGSINEVYDLLLNTHLHIIGEVYLRVEQCLIGLPGADPAKATAVYSHHVALAQCDEYLDEHLPTAKRLEFHDTAASVEHIKQLNDSTIFAIASRQAAELHGLEIIAESIETNKENYTRFVALSKEEGVVEGANKASLILTTNHNPGALYEALGCFAKNGINLTKIQSRPIIGKAWHYMFYVDIDAATESDEYQQASAELAALDCEILVLGSYKKSTL